MALVYFDSSAFVKLLVEEDGSDLAAQLWYGCDAAVSSRIAYPEVCAALAAAGRNRRLTARAQDSAERGWDEFWSATRAIELTGDVAHHAGGLARAYGLRAADAVHLASALALDDPDVIVAVWETRLRDGVKASGLRFTPLVT